MKLRCDMKVSREEFQHQLRHQRFTQKAEIWKDPNLNRNQIFICTLGFMALARTRAFNFATVKTQKISSIILYVKANDISFQFVSYHSCMFGILTCNVTITKLYNFTLFQRRVSLKGHYLRWVDESSLNICFWKHRLTAMYVIAIFFNA